MYTLEEWWKDDNVYAETYLIFDGENEEKNKKEAEKASEEWKIDYGYTPEDETEIRVVYHNCKHLHEFKWHNKEKESVDYYYYGELKGTYATLNSIVKAVAKETDEQRIRTMIYNITHECTIHIEEVNGKKETLVYTDLESMFTTELRR